MQNRIAEARVALPLIAGHAYHKGGWKNRKGFAFAKLLDQPAKKSPLAEKSEPVDTP